MSDPEERYEIEVSDDREPPNRGALVFGARRWQGVRVEFDRRSYHPFDDDEHWLAMVPRSMGQTRIIEEGRYFDSAGLVIEGKPRQRIVDRLLGKFDSLPPIFDPTAEDIQTRAYIPCLFNHDTVPAFVGPKGWGKTKLLCQFVAALLIPGRRLLGYFEPAETSEEERQRDLWMVVPETRPGAIHEELIAAGLVFGYRDGVPCYFSEELGPHGGGVLIVEHIQRRATEFDLTDPVKGEYWGDRFVEFTNRRMPPLMVIVDGITAILGNNTSKYGAFTSAFRQVLGDAGIPNGLGVLHSPMGAGADMPMYGIESSGEWDGLWLASADRFPVEPSTPRYFRALPRLGDPHVPKRRIVLDPDGMLRLVDIAAKPDAPQDGDSPRIEITRRLSESGEWMWTKAVCGTGDVYTANKRTLEKMETEGLVVSRHHTEGRTRGYQWKLSE